jgi:hypothetical protein
MAGKTKENKKMYNVNHNSRPFWKDIVLYSIYGAAGTLISVVGQEIGAYLKEKREEHRKEQEKVK